MAKDKRSQELDALVYMLGAADFVEAMEIAAAIKRHRDAGGELIKQTETAAELSADTSVYYVEWTVDGGHVPFGMHGTRLQWLATLQKEEAAGRKLKLTSFRKVETTAENA